MGLAIFDLDNTLLGGDSDHAWGEFLISRKLVDAATHGTRNDEFYRQYTEGRLNIQEYVRFTLGPVLGFSLDQLDELHREFMEEFVRPMMLPRAMKLIDDHKSAGDHCLIMSATNAFITRPIAREFAADDLLATDLVIQGGHYTGDISGVPCFQEGKVIRLRQWLELQNERYSFDSSTFYSDSINDLPLLEAVHSAVAVDPDDRLAAVADRKGWKIISLR